ncbi:SDR family NAD(P)-dependent oxidoreductase [Corynebacterium sp. S7]
MPELDSNRLLVIGAGPGLGASIAKRFAREGFAVTLAARTPKNLDPIVAELTDMGADGDTLQVDAANISGFEAELQRYAQHRAPGVVVYNVAKFVPNRILETPLAEQAAAYNTDVLGAIAAAQVLSPAMVEAGRGTFIITGGGFGHHPSPEYATLSIGKAGVLATSAILHAELAPHNVHATSVTVHGAIAPGTAFDPDTIAETYWQLHTQPAEEWTAETLFSGE